MEGCRIRECWFEPTFHKHHGRLCNALMVHAEGPFYHHTKFKPWRLEALALKGIRRFHSTYEIWRDFPYEYVTDRLAIDVINGGKELREWVDNPSAGPPDLEAMAARDEAEWREATARLLLY
jgi:uncharacterized protein YbbC (DUF1343 family)